MSYLINEIYRLKYSRLVEKLQVKVIDSLKETLEILKTELTTPTYPKQIILGLLSYISNK